MKNKVMLCSLPSDAHTWNLVVVEQRLREMGLDVHNMGSCVPIDELASAAKGLKPKLIVVSSINGHGEVEAMKLIDTLARAGVTRDAQVVIGGKLATSVQRAQELMPRLVYAGYADVYMGNDSLEKFADDLPQLLKASAQAGRVYGMSINVA